MTILNVFPDGLIVVATEGLYQVRIQPGDKVIWDLCDRNDAESYAGTFNKNNKGFEHRAEILNYTEVYQRQLQAG